MIKLTNSLTRKEEMFTPMKTGEVGMYTCGPTVYGTPSIGNFRAFIFSDVLRRAFRFAGYKVTQVINITDVGHLVGDGDEGEDKMITAMRREGKTAYEIARHYTEEFLRDMHRLYIEMPTYMPKATEHIPEQIELIKVLEEKGFTYRTSDGVYFDTSKLPSYGELSGQKLEDKVAGARVEVNPEKRNATDFALWKFSPSDVDREMEWDAPWGTGFPGWHIECSAMSEKYLDVPFDIHTGGIDHIPVHHENEIAQTRGARGELLANTWMHNAFLTVDGGKMSKSLGNVYTIDDLIAKGFDPLAFRYFVLGARYSATLNFTFEGLQAAQNALNNLRDAAREWNRPTAVDAEALSVFESRIYDDIDTPGALAQLWAVVKDEHLDSGLKAATILKFDDVLGLGMKDYVAVTLDVPLLVRSLIEERAKARKGADWAESDRLRDAIADEGFVVEDTADGQKVRERHS